MSNEAREMVILTVNWQARATEAGGVARGRARVCLPSADTLQVDIFGVGCCKDNNKSLAKEMSLASISERHSS